MVTKLDIMRQRKDEQWEIINGKVTRIEKKPIENKIIEKKIEGPIVKNGIKEIKEVSIKEGVKKKWKKKSKKM